MTRQHTGDQRGRIAFFDRALDDAGVAWINIECAFGGSIDAGFADTLVSRLGPSRIQFTNVDPRSLIARAGAYPVFASSSRNTAAARSISSSVL
jgi:hypothetical protein